MMPGITHWPEASMTASPAVSSGPAAIVTTRPSRTPMSRIADGPPVPSNQHPLVITVS